jgi:hypothetical protein
LSRLSSSSAKPLPAYDRDSGWQPWAYNNSFDPTTRLRLAAAQLHHW